MPYIRIQHGHDILSKPWRHVNVELLVDMVTSSALDVASKDRGIFISNMLQGQSVLGVQ